MQCTNKFFPLLELDFSVLKLIHVMWMKRKLGAGSVLALFDHTHVPDRGKKTSESSNFLE